MAVLKVDDRYRVVLDRQARIAMKISPGDELLAIPQSDGILITSLRGKKFNRSLAGFNYREEVHEASRYLFAKKTKKN